MNEFDLIEKIKKKIPRSLQGEIGIGDDAGVLTPPPGKKIIWTVDAIVEGVDFHSHPPRPGYLSAEQAGRKALAINLSDLAAMGAQPLGCVITLGIPRRMSEKWLLRFYDGLIRLARQYRVACVGGDITQASEFFCSIALAGFGGRHSMVRRSGAKPGNWIAVTGALGGSIQAHHASFTPRLREARFLVEHFKPTAMIDISDGLTQDLGHLLKSSNAGAVLEMSEIPISQEAARLAKNDPMKALERACTDGEDFELLFTMPDSFKTKLERTWRKRFPQVPLSWIGRIQKQKGIRWSLKGKTIPLKFKKSGYRHFE